MLIRPSLDALINAPTLMAIRGTEILFACSLLIQTLEYLRMGKVTADDGLWSWQLQRADIPSATVRAFLDVLFKARMHQLHLILRLLAALWLAVQGASISLIGFLFVGNLLILIRWRGAFNGGSDFMTLVVLTGLLIAQVVSIFANPQLGWQAGFWYIAIQSITSYFMSGAVKLLRPEWRNGSALTIFLNGAIYGPLSPTHPLRNKWLAMLSSWCFIGWEIMFPLSLLDPRLAAVFCAVAAFFHFLVFWFFGLNRFFWAWLCSFPAIIWCSAEFSARVLSL
ncbi:hypothetical protein [Limnohabitans sp. B9-3]|uniref:hypothetical protein n=1 Tax=Limnohabitans sp. B9-3 TaxID=1100707 RepID=UPI000CC10941|nr:hypothetical protein [Limnohabitans sp. B9-3]PIT74436.1 hypothetical protein B9Z42_09495 [Limnohabitans sp. B9-3]